MNWMDFIKTPRGHLEILVTDHKTGELIRREEGKNQIQHWARHALSSISAGRMFCTWGNHGEAVSDVGSYQIPHYVDGTGGDSPGDIITSTPWAYSGDFSGLIQVRNSTEGDVDDATTVLGASLYPFFPTKMRFGIGGLDADQNPRTDVLPSATGLQNTLETFPYVLIDRARTDNPHISLSTSDALNVTHKTTFSVKLPGGHAGYPYDGYVISEAGLFCDAALAVTQGASVDYGMRTGIMWAYRTFYGITKNESIDVTFNWTLQF